MSYFKVNDACNGCLACVRNCPAQALRYVDRGSVRTIEHNIISCARCGNCWRICPERAIEFEHLLSGGWQEVVTTRLVTCSVCGAPLYTEDFRNTLTEILDEEMDPLCPLHKGERSSRAWQRAVQTGKSLEEVPE
jgi:ferredoxin